MDLARLLVQLLGEEVDAQVAVLARGGRGRDADHLARVALQHQDIADPDVVAGDCDCGGRNVRRVSDGCLCSCASVALAPRVFLMEVIVRAGRLLPHLDHLLVDRLAVRRMDDPVRQLV